MHFGIEDDFLDKYLGPGTRAIEAQRVLTDDEKLSLWDRARTDASVMAKAVSHLGPEGTRRWAAEMERLQRMRGA